MKAITTSMGETHGPLKAAEKMSSASASSLKKGMVRVMTLSVLRRRRLVAWVIGLWGSSSAWAVLRRSLWQLWRERRSISRRRAICRMFRFCTGCRGDQCRNKINYPELLLGHPRIELQIRFTWIPTKTSKFNLCPANYTSNPIRCKWNRKNIIINMRNGKKDLTKTQESQWTLMSKMLITYNFSTQIMSSLFPIIRKIIIRR